MKNKNATIFTDYNLFLFLLILLFRKVFSIEELIDNIIQLGDENFRFNHFSLNSKGDMIIDTTAYPGNNERRFFGLKKNGKPYFYDENNIETPYRSLFVHNLDNENQQKLEGESNFIILSEQKDNEIKEYLLSFSILDNYMELYDFDKNEIITEKTTTIFKNDLITSSMNSFFKSKTKIDNKFNYYIAYIHYYNETNEFKFYILRCYFTSKDINNKGYHFDTGSRKSTINKVIASCFETELNKIACFYQKTDLKYQIVTLDEDFNRDTQAYTTLSTALVHFDLFFKAIHFKNEIGIFIYYTDIIDEYPIISLKYCSNEDNKFYNYKNLGNITVDKMSFNIKASLNDIIKLNDNKICYISVSKDKNTLIIVIFNIYNDDNNMMIRYYSYDLYNNNGITFYNDLRAFSFNDFISIAFSHCPQSECINDNDKHFSSLIIFNYPNNNNDKNVDLFEYIYLTNNNLNNFSFILDENINFS